MFVCITHTLLVVVTALVAHASEPPGWVLNPPRANAKYKYYVGAVENERTREGALRVARLQAQESAVRANFGVETSIYSASHESSSAATLDRSIKEKFPQVRLMNFEEMDRFVTGSVGTYSAWVLYRYPKAAILKEQARLRGQGPDGQIPFNEVGQAKVMYSTVLEVVSEPLGVPVFINDERWGVTPLRVNGFLPSGAHEVLLSHPNYEDHTQKVVLVRDRKRVIKKRMQPAMGQIRVDVTPSNSEVFVNGRRMNQHAFVDVLVGQPHAVEARAPGYDTQIQMIDVEKDEIRMVGITLNPKNRSPASEPVSEMTYDSDVEEGKPHWDAWVFGFFLGHMENPAPKDVGMTMGQMGFSLEKRFWRFFGIRGGVSLDFSFEESSTNNTTVYETVEGSGSFVGLPVYFSTGPSGLYVMPEVGRINHYKTSDSYSSSVDDLELKAKRSGYRVGLFNLNKNIDVWFAYHTYEWEDYEPQVSHNIGITWTFGGE